MAYADLRDFLRDLEREGDLTRVSAPVDPHLEVTEIVERVVRAQRAGAAVREPDPGTMPLAINVFGTERRMAKALGVETSTRSASGSRALLKPELPHGLGGLREALGKLGQLRAAPPKQGEDGALPGGRAAAAPTST